MQKLALIKACAFLPVCEIWQSLLYGLDMSIYHQNVGLSEIDP